MEDSVGGISDLRSGLIRTPRDPFKTFSDDPLRILRAARFAGRFGYAVHESIAAAAQTPSIQSDLSSKVSRERMGIELHKMLQLPSVTLRSFALLCDEWRLRRVIFEVPQRFEPAPKTEIGELTLQTVETRGEHDEHERAITQLCLRGMQLAHERLAAAAPGEFTVDESSSLLLAAFLIPYAGFRTEVKKGRFNTLAWYLVREAIRVRDRQRQEAESPTEQRCL